MLQRSPDGWHVRTRQAGKATTKLSTFQRIISNYNNKLGRSASIRHNGALGRLQIEEQRETYVQCLFSGDLKAALSAWAFHALLAYLCLKQASKHLVQGKLSWSKGLAAMALRMRHTTATYSCSWGIILPAHGQLRTSICINSRYKKMSIVARSAYIGQHHIRGGGGGGGHRPRLQAAVCEGAAAGVRQCMHAGMESAAPAAAQEGTAACSGGQRVKWAPGYSHIAMYALLADSETPIVPHAPPSHNPHKTDSW